MSLANNPKENLFYKLKRLILWRTPKTMMNNHVFHQPILRQHVG
jgi:hypothetical protein